MFVPAVILAVDKLLAVTFVAVTSPNTVIPSENIAADCNEFALNVSDDNVPILPNDEFNVPALLIVDDVILLVERLVFEIFVIVAFNPVISDKFRWFILNVVALIMVASISPASKKAMLAFCMSRFSTLKNGVISPPTLVLNIYIYLYYLLGFCFSF